MSDEIRHIENLPEIMWAESRSLQLSLCDARRVLRTDPGVANDLLTWRTRMFGRSSRTPTSSRRQSAARVGECGSWSTTWAGASRQSHWACTRLATPSPHEIGTFGNLSNPLPVPPRPIWNDVRVLPRRLPTLLRLLGYSVTAFGNGDNAALPSE